MKKIFLTLLINVVFLCNGFSQTWQALPYSDTLIKGPVYSIELVGIDYPLWYPFFLKIGGQFDTINFNNIYNWNGTQFGNNYGFCVNGPVYAISYWHWGPIRFAVGGKFTEVCPQSSPLAIPNFAVYGAMGWDSIDSVQINGTVRAITRDSVNGKLFVGGEFSAIYRVQAAKVPFATHNGSVYSLLYDKPNLYAGGSFSQLNSTLANNVMMLNGSIWNVMGGGMNDTVFAFTMHNNELYAGGKFTLADGNIANHIAKWNGTQWLPVGNGMNGSVKALLSYSGKLFAGGEFTLADGNTANHIAMWDGLQWTNVGAGFNGPVYVLEEYIGELYAGGSFTMSGTDTVNYIAKNSIFVNTNDINNNNSFFIYPNPTSGEFQLSVIGNQSSVKEITVYNVLGEKVYSSQLPVDSGQLLNATNNYQLTTITLDVPNGIYFVRVDTDPSAGSGGIVSKKVMVMR